MANKLHKVRAALPVRVSGSTRGRSAYGMDVIGPGVHKKQRGVKVHKGHGGSKRQRKIASGRM
jgi:hypothetical protein